MPLYVQILGYVVAVLALGLSAISVHYQYFRNRKKLYLNSSWLPHKEHGHFLVFTNGSDYSLVVVNLRFRHLFYKDERGKSCVDSGYDIVFDQDRLYLNHGEHLPVSIKVPRDVDAVLVQDAKKNEESDHLVLYELDVELTVGFILSNGIRYDAEIPFGKIKFDEKGNVRGFTGSFQMLDVFKYLT